MIFSPLWFASSDSTTFGLRVPKPTRVPGESRYERAREAQKCTAPTSGDGTAGFRHKPLLNTRPHLRSVDDASMAAGMSALGHKQTLKLGLDMSALPPKADVQTGEQNVR
jgi:hypothetical protein